MTAIGAGERIDHHDLCFGCGLANPFGLQLDLQGERGKAVRGRFFVKQDHQGPDGALHDGVLAAALADAMALAGGGSLGRIELSIRSRAPVGTHVEVEARVEPGGAASAEARGGDGVLLARARGELAGDGGG